MFYNDNVDPNLKHPPKLLTVLASLLDTFTGMLLGLKYPIFFDL